MAAVHTRVTVEFLASADDIPAGLWETCFPAPLEGRFWYATLERSRIEEQFAFSYALIRRDEQSVGIVPCFRHDVPISLVAPPTVAWILSQLARVQPRIGYQRTFFIGSPCSDEGTIGLVPGVTLAEVADELLGAVRTRARAVGTRMIVFKDFTAPDAAVLARAGPAGEFVRTRSYPGTTVTLPAPDKNAYYRALTQNRRHNLLKKLRRSREAIAIDTQLLRRPPSSVLDEIFGLFRQTYARGKTKFERLGPEFFARIANDDAARFIVQRDVATGKMLAFMLVFHLRDRVINKFIGIDYSRGGRTFLYFRLFDAALDFAYGVGARELQSGQTGYRAKFDLGHRPIPLFNVFHHDQPLVHALFRAIGRRITWKSLDSDLAEYLRAHPESSP